MQIANKAIAACGILRCGHSMHAAVHSHIAPIDIAVEVLSHQRVVQGGVEDDLLVMRAAFDLDPPEYFVPGRMGLLAHEVERSAGSV